jgi:hypothetical protein
MWNVVDENSVLKRERVLSIKLRVNFFLALDLERERDE